MSKPRNILLLTVTLLCMVTAAVGICHPRSVICTHAPSDDCSRAPDDVGKHISYPCTDGKRLSGWFFDRGENTPLVCCYSGNSANVSQFLPLAAADARRSYLLLNYRGYGSSQGRAEESTMVSDAVAAATHVAEKLKTAEIHLVGFSMGTCVATKVAAALPSPPAGLVLLCPFDSMYNLCGGDALGWRRHFIVNRFDVTHEARQLRSPITAVIADRDQIVSPARTAAILRCYPAGYRAFHLPTGHSDIFGSPQLIPLILQEMERNGIAVEKP